ncbi:hypothetical protein AURANDRAFT_69176, partial [Aureococcus anophagefferens]
GEAFKFDLRCWALLVGGGEAALDAYAHEPCYARLCSRPFALDDATLGDPCAHLSNLAVQKRGPGRVDEAALMRTQEALEARLGGAWERTVAPKIRRIVATLARCALQHASPRGRSFELLGVDVVLDTNLQPWLLECNLSPALARRSDDQSRRIDAMLRGALRRTVDVWFPFTAEAPRHDDGWRKVASLPAPPPPLKRARAADLSVAGVGLRGDDLLARDASVGPLAAWKALRAWWPEALARRRAALCRRNVAATFIQTLRRCQLARRLRYRLGVLRAWRRNRAAARVQARARVGPRRRRLRDLRRAAA